jgi:Fe-S cluster biosynthesis and repair protein YggX
VANIIVNRARRSGASIVGQPPIYNRPRLCEIIFLLSITRKIMAEHTVFCVKLHQELPGLDEAPFDTDLGNRVYAQVSRQAWQMWTEHCKMLLNEYRLNPARKEDQEAIVRQMEQYFFGEGAALPKEYVPPAK